MSDEQTSNPSPNPKSPEWFKNFETVPFGQLTADVRTTKEVALSNSRALRGSNGQPGLLTRFSVLERKVDSVFGAGTKIFLYIVTATIGVFFFIVTTFLAIIVYHILNS